MEGGSGVYNRKEQRSFRQFSDQLRLETTANYYSSNLSLGDSIWSDSSSFAKRADDRRNFDGPVSAQSSEFGWKLGLALPHKLAFSTTTPDNSASKNGGMKNWNYYNNNNNNNNYGNGETEINGYLINKHGNGGGGDNNVGGIGGSGKKKGGYGKNNSSGNCSGGSGNNGAVDKRFKTLPPSEALPRNEAVGGYIFVCNNETMEENLQRQLFGLPPRYRDSVRAITPGLPLFLYNYSTHQLHGIFEATSFGGTNIDPIAWEDKKCPGESRFPAQVRVMTRKLCEPLEEDAFRPILHHYDGPKFRLELNVQEALALLDIFAEQNA